MKEFTVSWCVFLGYAPAWGARTREERALLLEASTSEAIDLQGIDPEPLIAAQMLERFSNHGRVRLARGFRPVRRAMLIMRLTGLERGIEAVFHEYAALVLTVREREGLLGSDSYTRGDLTGLKVCIDLPYLGTFLKARDTAAWEQGRAEHPMFQSEPVLFLRDPQVGQDTKLMLQTLMQRSGPIRFDELLERVETQGGKMAKGISSERLGDAIAAALRYLLAFAWLDKEDRPVLSVWPTIGARLHRAEVVPPVSRDVTDVEWYSEPYGLSDLEIVVVRAAEPIRVKSDGKELYAKDVDALEVALLPGPARAIPFFAEGQTPTARVFKALDDAIALSFLSFESGKGRGGRYVVSDEGREWLRLKRSEKLRMILGQVLPRGDTRKDSIGAHSFSLAAIAAHDPYVPMVPYAKELLAMLSGLSTGEAVDLRDFLQFHSVVENPLLKRPPKDTFRRYMTTSDYERCWGTSVVLALRDGLMRFGGLAAGITPDQRVVIKATEIADYLFGRTDHLALADFESSAPPIRVQPDFEIVFLAPASAVESELTPFAERIGQGVGAVFRLTPESIRGAARAGLEVDRMEQILVDASGSPLPENVRHEIHSWHASTVQLTFENALILRCPDPETAARVMAAGGAKLELVGDRTLVLSEPKDAAKILRTCAKKGVFIDREPEPEKKPAARKRSRRRRYW